MLTPKNGILTQLAKLVTKGLASFSNSVEMAVAVVESSLNFIDREPTP